MKFLIGPEAKQIYVVDDGCPDATGERALGRHSPRLIAPLVAGTADRGK